MIPAPLQQPRIPFAVAAAGPRGMRLAAEFADTWVTTDDRGTGESEIARLDEICQALKRDPTSLRRLVLVGFSHNPLRGIHEFEDIAGRYAEAGFSDMVLHWPRDDEPFSGQRSTLDRIASDFLSPPD